MNTNKNQFLIIGTGRRVLDNIIPALKILDVKNILIKGRNTEKTNKIANKYSLRVVNNINENIINSLNCILIAIPETKILEFTDNINKFNTKNIILFIDTPILGPIKNLASIKLRHKYKKVITSEDFIYSPLSMISKKLISDNKLNFKKLSFLNCGYSYHSLAMGRFLANNKKIFFAYIAKDKIKKTNNYNFFTSSSRISILQEETPGQSIEIVAGNKYFSNNIKKISKKNFHIINPIFKNNIISHYELINKIELNKAVKKFNDEFNLSNIKKINYDIESQERIIAVSLMIKESFNDDSQYYEIADGVYDSFVIKFLRKFGFFIDIPFFKKSLIYYFLIFISFFL